jgi:nitronate monooxygenase
LSDFTPLWSGQNAAAARNLSAADITRDLVNAWQ